MKNYEIALLFYVPNIQFSQKKKQNSHLILNLLSLLSQSLTLLYFCFLCCSFYRKTFKAIYTFLLPCCFSCLLFLREFFLVALLFMIQFIGFNPHTCHIFKLRFCLIVMFGSKTTNVYLNTIYTQRTYVKFNLATNVYPKMCMVFCLVFGLLLLFSV